MGVLGEEIKLESEEIYYTNDYSHHDEVTNSYVNCKRLCRRVVASGYRSGAFFVGDLGQIEESYIRFCEAFPGMKLIFDLSVNSVGFVLDELSRVSDGKVRFWCNNKSDLQRLIVSGIESDRIIHGNPLKVLSHVRYAWLNGIRHSVFHSSDGLDKMKRVYPEAKLLLNISYPNSDDTQFWFDLLLEAKKAGMDVVGVVLDVVTPSMEDVGRTYSKAFALAKMVCVFATSIGYTLTTLHLGEPELPLGFSMKQYGKVVQGAVDKHFSDWTRKLELTVRISKFLLADSFVLATRVIAKRTDDPTKDPGGCTYVINDGLFGSFSHLMHDEKSFENVPESLFDVGHKQLPLSSPVRICGESGNKLDVVVDAVLMSSEIDVDGWILFRDVACYSMNCGAFSFPEKVLPLGSGHLRVDQFWFYSKGAP